MGSRDPLDVIERISRDVMVHVRMLSDAALRPEVDRDRLAASSLELLLKSIAVHLGSLTETEGLGAARRAQLIETVEAIRALQASSIRAEHHLSDLASGWRCSHCGSKVPREARVRGGEGAIEVSLTCQRCGRATELAPEGRAMFDKVFGPLAGPGWDPAQHGFVVETSR